MIADAERVRYVDYMRTRMKHGSFISRMQETEILENGHKYFHLQPGEARWILYGIAHEEWGALEADLDRKIVAILIELADDKMRIKKDDFETAAAIYVRWSSNTLGKDEAKRKLKEIMTELSYRPARNGILRPRRWFHSV